MATSEQVGRDLTVMRSADGPVEAWCDHYMPGAECPYCGPEANTELRAEQQSTHQSCVLNTDRSTLIRAAVAELTMAVGNETRAWNVWNILNTSEAFIAAFHALHPAPAHNVPADTKDD